MKVVVDLCLIPMGADLSLAPYVAECQRVLEERGLKHALHAYGTNIEGDWDCVMGAVRECHDRVHRMGAPRINSTLKIGTRTDREQSLEAKVASVREQLMGDRQ